MPTNSFYIGIFYPSGEQISLHLLRYSASAVDDHSITSDLFVRGNFKYSVVIASDRRECGNLNLLLKIKLPHSLRSSQQSLQQPRLVNNPGI
jgi:hypothetical protein